MAELDVQISVRDVLISEVESIWGMLKDLSIANPKIQVNNFNFRE